MLDSPNAIEFKSVTKKYGDVVAVDNLNLSIPRGKITVFVGHVLRVKPRFTWGNYVLFVH